MKTVSFWNCVCKTWFSKVIRFYRFNRICHMRPLNIPRIGWLPSILALEGVMFNSPQRDILSKHWSMKPYSWRVPCFGCLLGKNLTKPQIMQVTNAATVRFNVLHCIICQQEFNEAFWITESQCDLLQAKCWILYDSSHTWPKSILKPFSKINGFTAWQPPRCSLQGWPPPKSHNAMRHPALDRPLNGTWNCLMGTGKYDMFAVTMPCKYMKIL